MPRSMPIDTEAALDPEAGHLHHIGEAIDTRTVGQVEVLRLLQWRDIGHQLAVGQGDPSDLQQQGIRHGMR